jgi:subtilisin family serine protease
VVKYDARLDLESGYADTLFSTKICEAAYYVFAKAEQYGMPAVVNMSLGTHIGAHDGTSLFEECLSGLTAGAAGRALVAAAGNEYSGDLDYTGIHAGFELSDQPMATNFEIRNATNDGIYYIDVWGSAGGDLSVELAYNNKNSSAGSSSGFAAPGDIVSGSFLEGDIDYMINASEEESVLNGKPHVGIRIYVDPALNVSQYSFDLIIKGSGSFDAWLFPDKPARTIQFTSMDGSQGDGLVYVAGDRQKSIAIPATSPNVLAVGGYATRTRWTVGSLTWIFNGQQLGELLNFSSAGPSADPAFTGHKPEITAPGGMIAATKSSQATVSSQVVMDDGEHFLQSGTSMAAPFVSGTIAMMFQHNPNFTHEDVRSIIIQSAYVDGSVDSVPHDRWGNGKLDVLKAIEIAMTSEASGVFDANGSIVAPGASAATGKSSCQLAISSNQAVCAIDVALFLAFLLCLIGGRKTLATPE